MLWSHLDHYHQLKIIDRKPEMFHSKLGSGRCSWGFLESEKKHCYFVILFELLKWSNTKILPYPNSIPHPKLPTSKVPGFVPTCFVENFYSISDISGFYSGFVDHFLKTQLLHDFQNPHDFFSDSFKKRFTKTRGVWYQSHDLLLRVKWKKLWLLIFD